jgi:hypothetical protein
MTKIHLNIINYPRELMRTISLAPARPMLIIVILIRRNRVISRDRCKRDPQTLSYPVREKLL